MTEAADRTSTYLDGLVRTTSAIADATAGIAGSTGTLAADASSLDSSLASALGSPQPGSPDSPQPGDRQTSPTARDLAAER